MFAYAELSQDYVSRLREESHVCLMASGSVSIWENLDHASWAVCNVVGFG
jgi:aspartate/tyrosine/aromatic aminotransferase